ncbi:MAG: primosomal protein N' [Rhizobiales bacterium]|nr:primosomal protein N' [Hyphomicrobiales bacterium]
MPESKPPGTETFVSVLLPLAVEGAYSYLAGENLGALARDELARGDFVRVPLGTREYVGVVWDADAPRPDIAPAKLRSIKTHLDVPPLPSAQLDFLDVLARYNLAQAGMVLRMMLPVEEALYPAAPRKGVQLGSVSADNLPKGFRLTGARERVLAVAEGGLGWNKTVLASEAGVSAGVIDGLISAGMLEDIDLPVGTNVLAPDPAHHKVDLTSAQEIAAAKLRTAIGNGYSATLIDGVTGSGKTEVYFEAIATALEAGQQALVLLPEIALTAQFLNRFEKRFGVKPTEWHSDLTPATRRDIWRNVHRGEVRVVVGARSALFLPFDNLGLIIVDEEHDPAYKQVDRVSYHARDMAVLRGFLGKFPIVLASATPSIETQVNVDRGKYAIVHLPSRFGGQSFPDIRLIDLRENPPERGQWIAPPLVDAMTEVLAAGRQSLLFLNRRGYAPLTLCRKCGHRFVCPDCSSWLVAHRFRKQLQCHHCGLTIPEPRICPSCDHEDTLVACGPGVERIMEEVTQRFPDARTVILSSDLVGSAADMREKFEGIAKGAFDIIVGTQLIAKGHHFPNLNLVGVIDADLGLGHGDLRASERTFQLLHQVVGRAGRESEPGIGYLQTHMTEHPVMQALAAGDGDGFYAQEISARERTAMPPFGRLAGLLVTGRERYQVEDQARRLAATAPHQDGVRVLGPAEAPIGMVRGRHRFRLLVKAQLDFDLQNYLRRWFAVSGPMRGGVRLSVDIDPQSFL